MSLNNWELYCKVSEITNPVEALQDFDLVPRYIRLRTQSQQNNNTHEEKLSFQNFSCLPVSWLPRGSNFYSIVEKQDEVEQKVSFKDIKSQLLKVAKAKNDDDETEIMLIQDENQVVSMDASSFVALLALCPKKSDKVLDICCAPGMKLIAVCDLVAKSKGGVVVGLDASLERALVCRSLLAQHVSSKFAKDFGHCRLYLGDGRIFSSLTAEGRIQEELRNESTNPAKTARHQKYQLQKIKNGMKKRNSGENNYNSHDHRQEQGDGEKSVDARRRQREEEGKHEDQNDESSTTSIFCLWESESCPAFWLNGGEENGSSTSDKIPSSHFKFDRVLVDAECTHDGSVAHMNKFQQANFGDKSPNLFFAASSSSSSSSNHDQNEEKMLRDSLEQLYDLQFALLLNGYENCREKGGVLIYSTCSMSPKQNEEIVKKLLAHVGEGKIELVDPFEELSKIGKSGCVDEDEEYSEQLKFHGQDENEKNLTQLRRTICVESKILAKTYSLHPSVSRTSVQFIAKFIKK